MRKETNYLIVATLVVIKGGIIFYSNGQASLKAKQEREQENLAVFLSNMNVKLYGA